MANQEKGNGFLDTRGILRPELLRISQRDGQRTYGASQTWYSGFMQRMGGCGPTTASHLLWYLSRTRESCGALCGYDAQDREGFLRLMNEVWKYIKPGMRGVNSTGMFVDGARKFGADRGVALDFDVLDVRGADKPSLESVEEYLCWAFDEDLAVAFLNLDNGALHNLENWHWVTLVGYREEAHAAVMYDQGRRSEINMELWLRSIAGDGGFVAVKPKA